MLELRNISKTFFPGTVHEKTALDDLSLTLHEGDFVTVIGGNGAGKSTMLNARQQTDLGGHPVFQSQIKNPQLLLIELPVRLGDTGPEGSGLAPACRQRKVFLDLHSCGSAHHGVLKHAPDERRALIVRETGDVVPVDDDRAAVHGPYARYRVEKRRLACAVAADHGDEIALFKMQIDARERPARAEDPDE